jgi:hypothetical protein
MALLMAVFEFGALFKKVTGQFLSLKIEKLDFGTSQAMGQNKIIEKYFNMVYR